MNRKNNKPFVGRVDELAQLRGLIGSRRSALVVIKGRRRIGKSRLVTEFAFDQVFLPFAGLSPVSGITAQDQLDSFARQLAALSHLPPFTFTDWFDAFAHLSRILGTQPTVILFDEISWMGSKDPTFLSKLKIWWDQLSEQKSNVMLILCGSVSLWIEENIINSTAFFGRISLHITLNPLSLAESAEYLKKRGVQASSYDIYRLLAITGGVPWYLENVQTDQTIDENIKRLCFSSNGMLVHEFNLIFHDLFDQRGQLYKQLLVILADGMRDYDEIRKAINYPPGGGLAPYLDALIISGYVTKHQSWSIKTGSLAKKSLYRLSDNYLRFFLKVIEPMLVKIQVNSFVDMPISAIPGWNSMMGLQIENLLLNNRRQLLQSIGIHPQDVVMDNPFVQRRTKVHAGIQIDYLVQTSTKTIYLCEFKFSRHEVRTEVIKEVQNKMDALVLPRGFSICPVLFHFSGVSDAIIDAQYFYRTIDVNRFLGFS